MKKDFLVSLALGLIPTVGLTSMAIMNIGNTKLGGILFKYQAGYALVLLFASILLRVLKNENIAKGLLVSFIVAVFVSLIRVGWGI